MPRRGTYGVVAIALVPLNLWIGCVDGVTPDCSDAAAACGPELDGAAAPPLEAGSSDVQTERDSGSDGAPDGAPRLDASED
jgi:hypothetical protein